MNFERKIDLNQVTIGSDPECFLFSEKLNKFIPVCGLLGGTKKYPIKISDEGHAIQEDNVAAEWCIPPCKSSEEFISHINFVRDYINKLMEPKELVLKPCASAFFEFDDLQTKQARRFGCDPSLNAWTGRLNSVNKKDVYKLLRSAGFHIHIGYNDPDVETSMALAQAFDIFLTIPSLLIDTDEYRRELYGKAGDCRLKPYGVECRQLSSYFLSSNELIKWVYDSTLRVVDFVNSGNIITNPEDIQKAVNSNNLELALEIMDDYNIEMLNYEIKN